MARTRRALSIAMVHGGNDGVSVTADEWMRGLEALGWQAVEVAGSFGSAPRARERVRLPSLYSAYPFAPNPPVDEVRLEALVGGADLVVMENIATLPVAPDTALAIEHLARRVPTIVRHYDPPWNDETWSPDPRFPLPFAHAKHVAVNAIDAARVSAALGLPVEAVHLTFDTGRFARGSRAAARARLGVDVGGLLLAHPVIPYPHKQAALAARFALQLEALLDHPVVYWLTGVGDEHLETQADLARALVELGPRARFGRVADVADLYAAADMVLLSSRWEGWGLPVVEAAAAGRMPVCTRYPVLAEITAFGITTLDLTDPERWIGMFGSEEWDEMVRANAAAVRAFDSRTLSRTLSRLVAEAEALVPSS